MSKVFRLKKFVPPPPPPPPPPPQVDLPWEGCYILTNSKVKLLHAYIMHNYHAIIELWLSTDMPDTDVLLHANGMEANN